MYVIMKNVGTKKWGLTDERLLNSRFRRVEDAILRVFFKHKGYINVRSVTSEVGMARGTFYGHHKMVASVIPDYKDYVYKKYSVAIGQFSKSKDVSAGGLYRRMLIFILRERRNFGVLVRAKDKEIFTRMVLRLRSYIAELDGLSGNTRNLFDVYSGEIAEILFIWGKGGFREEKMEEVLGDILQVTSEMRVNLTKLNLYRE